MVAAAFAKINHIDFGARCFSDLKVHVSHCSSEEQKPTESYVAYIAVAETLPSKLPDG